MGKREGTKPIGRMQAERRTPGVYGGYPRVSRKGTREDERLRSPQFQRDLIEAKARAEGVAVRMFPAEIDVSGAKLKRAILDEILAGIERGELAGIIVAKLDRFSRLPAKERIGLVARIEDAGGRILSASEDFNAATPEGRFMRDLFFGLARMEWEKKADDFNVAKVNAIENGIAIKTTAPYGYRFNETHGLEVDEAASAIVRELYEMRLAGGSYGDCQVHLERERGGSSARSAMKYLLSNRAYLGELRYGRGADALVKEGAHPAIVDVELFEAVQRVNEARSRVHGYANSGRKKSLLAGIAKCASCGTGLVQTRQGSAMSLSYKCPRDKRHCGARAHMLARELEPYVVDKVLEWVGPTADQLVELDVELDAAEQRIVAEQRLAEAERMLLDWSTDLERQERSPQAYEAGLQAREERVERRRQELERLGQASEHELARSTLRLALAGDGFDVDERRRLLAVVLRAVVVRRTPGRGTPAAERVELLFGAPPPPAEFAVSAGMVAEDGAELLEQAHA